MSSSPLQNSNYSHVEASSSRSSPPRQPYAVDVDSDNEADLLSADPLNEDLGAKYVLVV
jgi:putative cell wall-binding protein